MRVFDKQWFHSHNVILLWGLNTPIIRYVFRKMLGISYKGKIYGIEPNCFLYDKKILLIEGELVSRVTHEFHTFPKYAKRLQKRLYFLWFFMHIWDLLVEKRINHLSFGFSSFNFNPDAEPETSTVDGYAGNDVGAAGTPWATLIAAAGTDGTDGTATILLGIISGTNSNEYRNIDRPIILFDTSSIDDSAVINTAIINLMPATLVNGLSGQSHDNSRVVALSAAPASNTALAAGDYDSLGVTSFGESDIQANVTENIWMPITLNASGIANIDKTGISKFGFKYKWDFGATTTGLTWSSAATQKIPFRAAESSSDPTLTIVTDLSITGRHVGFIRDWEGNLYASTADGTTQTKTAITGITITNKTTYRIEYTAGVSALFYVDDVLKTTITTNLPSGATNLPQLRMTAKGISPNGRIRIRTNNNYQIISEL